MTEWKKKFTESAKEALSPWNIAKRIVLLLGFGILTGFPYVVFHMNKVTPLIQEADSFFLAIWYFVKALFSASASSAFLVASTVWNSIINPSELISQYGTIMYLVLSVPLLYLALSQISKIVVNALDSKTEKPNPFLVFLVTIFLILLVSFGSFFALDGKTILDNAEQEEETIIDNLNESINETVFVDPNYVNLLEEGDPS